jgi:hypothetical protein
MLCLSSEKYIDKSFVQNIVRDYLHIWPICHIYGVYYIYFNIIYVITVIVISINLDYRNGIV